MAAIRAEIRISQSLPYRPRVSNLHSRALYQVKIRHYFPRTIISLPPQRNRAISEVFGFVARTQALQLCTQNEIKRDLPIFKRSLVSTTVVSFRIARMSSMLTPFHQCRGSKHALANETNAPTRCAVSGFDKCSEKVISVSSRLRSGPHGAVPPSKFGYLMRVGISIWSQDTMSRNHLVYEA